MEKELNYLVDMVSTRAVSKNGSKRRIVAQCAARSSLSDKINSLTRIYY